MRKFSIITCVFLVALSTVLTGCEELREFAGDSIDNVGEQVSTAVDTIEESLGLADPTPVITNSPKPAKVYVLATPVPSKTPEELEEEARKREEIAEKARAALNGSSATATPTPSPTGKEKGGKKKKATPIPSQIEEVTPEATPETTPEATPSPTQKPAPTPTPKPSITSSPVEDNGGVSDW